MKNLNLLKYLVPIILALVLLATCRRNYSKPGLEYAPDMFHSRAFETYTKPFPQHWVKKTPKFESPLFDDGQTALIPPEGAISVNHHVYDLPNTPEAYAQAVTRTTNPAPATKENIERGKQIYTIHCQPCHGKKGDGEGTAVVGSDYKLAPPPIKFNNPTPGYLTPGRMFFTVTYGKGSMGSYASQVNTEDRWKVIHYIKTLDKSATAKK